MGSKTGLEAIEKTVIDRAVQMIYQPYFADPRPENMPILGDLMNALLSQHIPEADRVAPGAGPVCERFAELLQPPVPPWTSPTAWSALTSRAWART